MAEQGAAPRPAEAEPSWLALGLWFAALALTAALCAVLLWAFFRSRPVDLTPQTDAIAAQVVRILEAQMVPRDAIAIQPPGVEVSPLGRWSTHRIEVAVPPRMEANGLKNVIRRELLAHHVHATDATLDGAGGLVLRLTDVPFAEVRFVPGAGAAQRQADLRPSIERVAREVDALLAEAGIAPEHTRATLPVEMADDEARWTFATRAFALPPGLSAGELRGRLAERLATRDVRVATEPGPYGAVKILIAFAGKRFMELACDPATAAPEPADTDTPEEATPPPDPPADSDAAAGSAPLAPAVPEEYDVPMDALVEGDPEPATPPGSRAAPREGPPRVAIILDDGGYGGAHTEQILNELDTNLTLAILPNTPHAGDTARRGRARGFEIMLHMPMETHGNGDKPFPGEITTAMEADEIQRLARAAIAQIPGLAGVNNHTGSKFTSDRAAMRAFLPVVRDLGFYFVDSVTLAGSVAFAEARAMGIPAARRDVFLDNEKDPAYIRGQLDELVARAKERGSAIGIGHFRPNTVAVLAEYLPTLDSRGVRLVHVSELLE